ncbi:unnamed protein product [Ectocarpus sp. CCAP 1310/34]|nr:unnamed protein product [Ectocarpus sp. CCAP 1310/34]
MPVAETHESVGGKLAAATDLAGVDAGCGGTKNTPPPAGPAGEKNTPTARERGGIPLPMAAIPSVAAEGTVAAGEPPAAGEEQPAHADKSAERAEFGSSAVTFRSTFARGYDHRRRGRAYSSTLPPPPPQAPPGVGGGSGWAGLRDLDGCVVWYTESVDSAAEADIESLASRAESVDSREDDLDATASTDSEVASTASSTGGASSVCSGDSSRNRVRDRDLSLELCSTWSEEGEEDVLLGLSLARARMTAGKAACSCRETSCFCRFRNTSASFASPRNRNQNPRTVVPLPPPGPLARSELDPRDLALVAEINCMAKGSRDRRGRGAGDERGVVATPGDAPVGEGMGAAGAGVAAARTPERLAVHPDCAFEFAERFVRRDIALAGRVQAVRLLYFSTNSIFSVVVRCGGFRALYGWLGDVWERVRAHKLARAGPPQWKGVGGRLYVEGLLCVLARVPISVDMLRETEIARVAKKFRRLAERHGLESMTKASNQLRAHLHAVVSRGVQEGLFFRNRGSAAAAGPADYGRGGPLSQFQHPSGASMPYPVRRPEPWNSKEGESWRANGKVGGTVGFREYGGPTRGRAYAPGWRGGGRGGRGGSSGQLAGDPRGAGGGNDSMSNHFDPPLPFSGMNLGNRPGLRSVQLKGWRCRQGGGDDTSSRGGGSDAGSVRGEDDARASDEGKRSASNHSGSADGSPTREGARGELAGEGAGHQMKKGEKGQGEAQHGNGGNSRSNSNPAAAGALGGSPEPSSVPARRSGNRSAPGAGRAVVGTSGGRKGHPRRSSWRRASKTEPWVLDLSNSGREDEQRRAARKHNSPQRAGYGGSRQGKSGDEGVGSSRWHGGENRMFRPLYREEAGRFSDFRHHPSNASEDGSWEGTGDWWPRPRSPPPAGAADTYYASGDYDSGMYMNSFPGPQGASSLLPAVPTFEESGTRVSWADHRGHNLAEVHEIEPGYSRGDFALPGHVGFITEACRRDMSKKEEQLLSLEDHERLAAAALESDVLRGRGYGSGAGGDSEGTISDSENSTTGDLDGGYQSNSSGGGGEGRERSASDDGSEAERRRNASSNPALLPNSPASSGGSQDGDDASETAVARSEDDKRKEGDARAKERSSLQQNGPRTSLKNNSGAPNNLSDSQSSSQNSPRNSPQSSPRRSLRGRREPGDEGGSESGCSSIHSPQRCFSPMEGGSPLGAQSSAMAPQRRFTSPSGRRSPPRSPSVSSPGSSRSGSVADGHVMFESGESSDQSHRDTVCRPPLAHNPWGHHHEHQHKQPWELDASGSREKPRWESGRGRINGGGSHAAGDPARRGRGGRIEGLRGRGRGVEDEEQEEEDEQQEEKMYRTRATAAMLLGVKSRSVDSREGLDVQGRGRKRRRRDLDRDDVGGSLGPLTGSCSGGSGGGAAGEADPSSRGFPDSGTVRNPPWFEHHGGLPLPRDGGDVVGSAARFSSERSGGCGRPRTRRRVKANDRGGGRAEGGGEGAGVDQLLEGAGSGE